MYAVKDLSKLIRHHLVLSTKDAEVADIRLARLMRNVELMSTTPRWLEPIRWMAREECGAWVSSELRGPDEALEEGCFRCAECTFANERPE